MSTHFARSGFGSTVLDARQALPDSGSAVMLCFRLHDITAIEIRHRIHEISDVSIKAYCLACEPLSPDCVLTLHVGRAGVAACFEGVVDRFPTARFVSMTVPSTRSAPRKAGGVA